VTAAEAREADPSARGAPRLAMAGALVVLGLVAIDVAAVPAVLPAVRVDLGSSSSGLVWVQDAYLLALAVTFLLSFPISVDRRLLAPVGVAAFAGGALLASTAGDTAALVTGRALQGAGTGALLVPALESLRPADGKAPWGPAGDAPWALASVGAGALLALAIAPLAGGALAEESSWPWLFRIELVAAVPALLVVATGGGGAAPERRAGRGRAPGGRLSQGDRAATLALGLILAVTGLVQSGPWGWASADTLLLVAGGGALLAFAQREGPAGADAAVLALAGCLSAALLLAPQYLELVRGLSPLRSGLLTTVLTLSAAMLATLARVLAGRVPHTLPVVGGLACATLGALGMTRIDPASSYALVVISLGLLGSGIGAATGALATRADGVRLVAAAAPGAALVVAAAGALVQRAQLEEREAGGSFEDALAAGLAASGWLMTALLAAAAVLAWRRGSSSPA
jgi:MFS transporter, DHA2 family, multidrug resistance protein